jgi:hypothetical protein
MILIKKIYAFILYVSDSGLQCNKHNSYWYGVQYQGRQTALDRGTGQWKWYCPSRMVRSPRRYHLRYYLIWIDYSNCLNGVQLIMGCYPSKIQSFLYFYVNKWYNWRTYLFQLVLIHSSFHQFLFEMGFEGKRYRYIVNVKLQLYF